MFRNRINIILPPALLLLGLLLVQCVTEDRQAGTSTTVGNTLSAVAVLSDGKPAAYARASLRARSIQVSRNGVPSSRLIAFATADSGGAFALPRVADSGALYLEVAQSPDDRPALQRDSLESLLLVYPSSLPDSLGTLALQAPGGLSGRLLSVGGAADSAHWIGAQGTDNFTRVNFDGTFRLDGLAPGPQTLVDVDVADVSIHAGMSFTVKFAAPPAASVAVKSKQVTDLGGMLYYTGTAPRIGVP